MSSPLSTFALARRNIGRRPWRSFCLVAAVVLFSACRAERAARPTVSALT